MSDVRQLLGGFRDAPAVPMPTAATVRRRADRRRGRRRAAAAGTLVVLVCGSGALVLTGDGGGPRPTVPAGTGSGPAGARIDLDRPWLPEPWRVVSAGVAPLPAGGPDDPFCGLAGLADLPDLPAQTLTDRSAEVRLYAVATPASADAGDLFKRLYAECGARTRVESREGPALYWSTPGPGGSVVRNAARWDGATLLLLSLRDPGAGAVDVAGLLAAVRVA